MFEEEGTPVGQPFTFEPGPFPLHEGNVRWEIPNLNLLPPAHDFSLPVPLAGDWQPKSELELSDGKEFTDWELSICGNVELEPDISLMNWERAVGDFKFPDRIKPEIPDVSKGLGQRKDRADLVSLQKFAAQSHRFMVLNGQLCVYHPPCWKKLSDLEAERTIRALVEEYNQGYCLTQREYAKIREGLLCDPSIPCRTGEINAAENKINFLDGTLDLEMQELYPHNPSDNFFSVLNVRCGDIPSSSSRVFEKFVSHISNGDAEVREQLLQLIALVILRKPLKHFFVLVGPSNTGKTQFGRFLEELVGHEQTVCVRDIHDFDDRWTAGSLEGKTLALCLDLPNSPLPPRAVGIVKQLVGDDAIKAEKKYKDPYTYHHKPLLLMAGNHPLRISGIDRETALLNRMVAICFQNPVQERDMRQALYLDLLNEAPYIVGQAIQSYYRLERNNFKLTQVPLPQEYMPQDARYDYHSIAQFLEQCCEFVPEAETSTSEIYSAYCAFSEMDSPLINFSKTLRELLERHPEVSAIKRVGGREQRGYRGIRLIK